VHVNLLDKTTRGRPAHPRPPVVLVANQQATVVRDQVQANEAPPFDRALQWTDRRLVAQEEPLADVIAEFNRYYTTPVRIPDPELAQLKINGTFEIVDRASLLAFLSRYEGVGVEHEADAIVIRRIGKGGWE
jgi:transmembrane sensor